MIRVPWHLEGSWGDALGICEALQGPGQDRAQGSVRSKVLSIFPESCGRSLVPCDLPRSVSQTALMEAWAGKTLSPSGRSNSSHATTSSLLPLSEPPFLICYTEMMTAVCALLQKVGFLPFHMTLWCTCGVMETPQ